MVQLAEMKNGECTDYKRECIKHLLKKKASDGRRKKKLKINRLAHDCACVSKDEFEGRYCDQCLLDNYHKKKHKCKVKGVVGKSLNSLAAEQLWSVMHHYQMSISRFDRPRYRCFLKHYCIWRNSYVRSNFSQDVNPSISCRRAARRVRQS